MPDFPFLEHGKYRMLDVLRHEKKLGGMVEGSDMEIFEALPYHHVKRLFYKHVDEEELKFLESINFDLSKW
ncbi:MAG: hypothetical protein GWN31_14925 [Candidatus Thorarchaeota archaeon]|nr:hypothetical protein [Candidatus Thorarchaeota archaeon]NIW15187.1 hypothetical protein [Candidatus Thorarchaeota archaeon]NIW53176.1 hypothetical protein [Candidatus Korarchaeota archaeon]